MEKKKTRNRFRDTFTDYYRTNRQISKEYEESWREDEKQGKKAAWSGAEKLYLGIILVGVVLIVIKYVIL